MGKLYTVPEFAERVGVTRQSVYNWVKENSLEAKGYRVHRMGPRSIRIEDPNEEKPITPQRNKVVAYVRVSTNDQKDSLVNQELALHRYAAVQGFVIDEVVSEIGSGFNGNRPKLKKLLKRDDVQTILVENTDRLIRTNFPLFELMLSQLGVTVTVVNPETGDLDKDLMKEILDFFVSACGRFYGKRGAQRIKEKIKEGIE